MSGHKRATVSIPEEEYRRLHEAETRLRHMQTDLPEIIERAGRQTHHNLLAYFNEFERRQIDFVSIMQEIDADLAALEARTGNAMIEHQSAIQHHLSDLAGSLWEQAGVAIADVEQRYQDQIQEVQQANSEDLLALSEQIQDTLVQQHEREQAADHWLNAAYSVANFIQGQYDHEHLSPGLLRGCNRRLLHARQNLHNGMPEAALALAQDAYCGLSDLRVTLEKLQAEYNTLLEAVQEYLLRLEHLAHASYQVPAMDTQGNLLPYQIEVDFWCSGDLHELTRKIETLRAEITQSESRPTIRQLEQMLQEELPGLDQQLDDVVFRARLAVLSSQLRLNIADRVLSALGSQGYNLDGAFFEGDDSREPYAARLFAMDGAEILVRVDPIPDQAPKNELHLIAQDHQDKTMHEMRQRALEVQRALRQAGMDVGRLMQLPEPAPSTTSQTERSQLKLSRRSSLPLEVP